MSMKVQNSKTLDLIAMENFQPASMVESYFDSDLKGFRAKYKSHEALVFWKNNWIQKAMGYPKVIQIIEKVYSNNR